MKMEMKWEKVKVDYLAIKSPWPSMLRTVYGDDKRYIDTYWSQHEGLYFAGDGAKYDDDGYIWLLEELMM